MKELLTGEVARELGTTKGRIRFALFTGRISPRPAKSATGEYLWTPEDVERARQALGRDRRRREYRRPENASPEA